jgi:hypothetical protein
MAVFIHPRLLNELAVLRLKEATPSFGGLFAVPVRMKTRLYVAFTGALLLLAHTVSAQTTGPYATTFSANFDVAYHESGDDSNAGAHFDLAGTVKRDVPMVAIVGEAGFNHFSDATVASVLGGARMRIPIEDERFLPFAQVLFGLYHCSLCNANDFALQAGGGVDFRVPRRRSFRLRAQLDFRHVFNAPAGFDALRLSGGIVLPLNAQ